MASCAVFVCACSEKPFFAASRMFWCYMLPYVIISTEENQLANNRHNIAPVVLALV